MSNDAMFYMRNIPNIAIGMGMPCSTHQKPFPMGALRIYKGRTLAWNVTNLAPPHPHTLIFSIQGECIDCIKRLVIQCEGAVAQYFEDKDNRITNSKQMTMILKLVLLLDDAIMTPRSLCIEIIHIQRKFMKPHTLSVISLPLDIWRGHQCSAFQPLLSTLPIRI